MPKTTKKQFEYFKSRFRVYAKVYGITEWDVIFALGTNDPYSAAEVECDMLSMTATVKLNDNLCGHDAELHSIDMDAFHEVWEIILAKLMILASERFTAQEQLESVRHEIISRVQNTHFEGTRKLGVKT